MPPLGRFTNVRVLREHVETSRSRLRGPYMAGMADSSVPATAREREFLRQARILTPKEKEARRQARLVTGSFDITADVGWGSAGSSLGGNTMLSGNGNAFSPQLSTDFLELPQSLREKREIYRHFYNTDPLVGQAIDLHTELPLSKVRLASPKPKTCPEGFESSQEYGRYIMTFFERMCKRVKLFQRLITMVHELWVQGNCLAPHVPVTTLGGVKRADELAVGDLVLTHKSRWRPIEVIKSREADEVLRVKVARLPEPLDVTPEHPLEVYRDGRFQFVGAGEVTKGDFVRITWPKVEEDVSSVDVLEGASNVVSFDDSGYTIRRSGTRNRLPNAARAREGLLEWLSNLREPTIASYSDLSNKFGVSKYTLTNVIVTLDSEIGDWFHQRIGADGFGKGSRTVWHPLRDENLEAGTYLYERDYRFDAKTCLNVDGDFLYLVGYWLGDGTLARDSARPSWGRGLWNIYFGSESIEQYAKVKGVLLRALGGACVRESIQETGVKVLSVRHHPAFIEWWAANFGGTSHGREPKRIPGWVTNLPIGKVRHLVAGVIDSDGCVSTSVKGQVSLGLTSEKLFYSFRDMFLKVGLIPAVSITYPEEGRIDGQEVVSNHPFYTMVVDNERQCRSIAPYCIKGSRLDLAGKFTSYHTSYIEVGNDIAFVVDSIESAGRSTVYNVQVAEDNTFRAGYVSTHNCFIFAEDSEVQVPSEVGYEALVAKDNLVTDDGAAVEAGQTYWVERQDREDQELLYYQKHYKGWERLVVLPIDQIRVQTYSFTDRVRVELMPSEKDKALIEQARIGADPVAVEMAREIPDEIRECIEQGRMIPLGTDPEEGSFVYHLAGRRGAKDELGQSILDRCHLPSTPVLVQREGQVRQVPIEDIDPETDLILSAKGIWREFEVGSRPVREKIVLLHVSKIDTPIGCTLDHRHVVLRDGVKVETVAGDIRAGDYLQIARLPLTESVRRVDLADFMHGIEGVYKARKSGASSPLSIEVVDRTSDSFLVRYKKEQTDPRGVNRTNTKNTILEWAASLTEPVRMRSAEVCKRFDLNPSTLKDIRRQLVALGYGITVTKGKEIVFSPNVEGLLAPTNANYVKSFPRNIELDADFGYFIGYWLGDGHIARQEGLDYGTLGFTYGAKEPTSVLSIEQKIKPILNKLKVGWSETPMKGCTGVNISGSQDALIRWMATNFGHVCEDKHLPAWVFDAPKDFLLGLLRGFCDSDGYVSRKKDGSISVGLTNTNATLIDQLFLVCTSFGLPVSKTQLTEGRWVRRSNGHMEWCKAAYSVEFTHGPSVRSFFETGFLAKRKDPDTWKDGRSGSRHVEHDGNLYYRVSSTGEGFHQGPVYSLNVHEDHSFFTAFVGTLNCLRTLYLKEKLRQAQTQIASRAMTPRRIVWAEDISEADAEALREQVDLALVDPDYSVVANFEVHWDEQSSRDRLLDLQSEYEQADKHLMTGLGVTESLMSGESLYSGDRLKLEVINTRYLFLREVLQEYVEDYLFKPVARRKGFVEKDKWGDEVVLYPRLSFTRLPLRDSQDTFDAMFNLYQKGSLPVSIILEMFNIDPIEAREGLEADMFTINDSTFNEVFRGMYNDLAGKLVEQTDIVEKIAKYLKLKIKPPEQDPGRF